MTEIYKTVNVFDKQDNFVATFHEVVSVDFGKQGKTIIGTKYGDVELSGEYAVRVAKQELVDKETPMKLTYNEDKEYYCPKELCGSGLKEDQPFCLGCGQKIDWSPNL